jgi:signal transduction histidine kinase
METLTADQRRSVDQVVKGGEHLLELINEVLDIAQIESGALRLFLEPVSIERAADDAVDLIRPLAEGRGIDLRVELPADASMRRVLADERRLGQVLLNLLANAVKYTEGTVSVTATPLEGDRLRLSVTDTGPGISEEKLSGLFTPFERLGAEATAVQGTGLGLALSQHLVIAMGGQIGVESTVGEGTTFWVELPEAEEGTGDEAGSRSSHEKAPVPSG